jgi:thiol:disulfide interchange protein
VSKSGLLFLTALALSVTTAGCGSTSADSPESNEAPAAAQAEAPAAASAEAPAAAQAEVAAGSYIDFADYEANKDAYASSNVVLFFNAAWCSTCKIVRDNIAADPTSIPADLTIVQVDFDSATELKRKHGVTVQHTFVQVDPAGNELAKWAGSLTAEEIAQNTV